MGVSLWQNKQRLQATYGSRCLPSSDVGPTKRRCALEPAIVRPTLPTVAIGCPHVARPHGVACPASLVAPTTLAMHCPHRSLSLWPCGERVSSCAASSLMPPAPRAPCIQRSAMPCPCEAPKCHISVQLHHPATAANATVPHAPSPHTPLQPYSARSCLRSRLVVVPVTLPVTQHLPSPPYTHTTMTRVSPPRNTIPLMPYLYSS